MKVQGNSTKECIKLKTKFINDKKRKEMTIFGHFKVNWNTTNLEQHPIGRIKIYMKNKEWTRE